MAEKEAGQLEEGQEEQLEQPKEVVEGAEPEKQAERTYTQAELDRILGKVRKNARYLGRKEAEAELMARGATRQQAEATVDRQQEQPKPPKREDFENYEDYLDAKVDYRTKTASQEDREARDKAAREQRVTEERQRVDREFAKHAKAVIAKNPEIAEAIEAADDVQMSQAMGDAVKEAGEIGIHILHYLVQHPEEAERISSMGSERAQTREIGKLEAKIEAQLKAKAKPQGEEGDEEQEGEQGEELESEAEEKGKDAERRADGTFKPSKKRAAPEPIEPGSARSATGSKLPSDKDDINTWMRKEDERERREGRR
jgi:hypothetical protein